MVGTIITQSFLEEWRRDPRPLPCDLVELRVDGFPDYPGWLEIGEQIEARGTPVFATVRFAQEGGKWDGPDASRWPLLEGAVQRLSGADVELASPLAPRLAQLAAERQKLCVLSHHNFQSTPPVARMRQMLQQAHAAGAIGKIAATANTPEDLAQLRSLLHEKWDLPVCLIGMGPLGRETRLAFPREGSCFTYGYLDTAGAPGQYSAAELSAHFQTQR